MRRGGSFSLVLKITFICIIAILIFIILFPESRFSLAVRRFVDPLLPEKLRSTQVEKSNNIRVFFSPSDIDDPNGVDDILVALIDSAKTEIKAAIYSLKLNNITNALINAKSRGVNVYIVYDESNISEHIRKASDAGIKVVYRPGGGGLMHNKFFVVDGMRTWTGSMNLTPHGVYYENNNSVLILSEKVAKNFSTEFDEMFAGSFGYGSPENTPYPRLFINGTEIETYFAPENKVEGEILQEINKAKKEIVFMAFSFTNNSIAKAMAEKIKSGVSVKGVFEKTQGSVHSEYEFLNNSGADVQWDLNRYNMHHKVIVIDEETVITGSYNFSKNAERVNDENCIIIHNREIAGEYIKEYQRLIR